MGKSPKKKQVASKAQCSPDSKIACLSESAKLFNILLSKTCLSITLFSPGEFVVLRSDKENEIKGYGRVWPSSKASDAQSALFSDLALTAWKIEQGQDVNLEKLGLARLSTGKLILKYDEADILGIDRKEFELFARKLLYDVKNLVPHLIGHVPCSYLGKIIKLRIDRVEYLDDADPGQVISEIDKDTIIKFVSEKTVKRGAVKYTSVGGLEKELLIIKELIETPLLNPEKYAQFGIRPPRGVLLHGPPGTGKTLIARAIGNETGANVIVLNGPDIIGKHYGESEENLRRVFQEAIDNGPSIIFIDEIDSLCPTRDNSSTMAQNRITATLLTLMDGSSSDGKFVVLGATNRPDALDSALRRPGRFDREVEIGIPSPSSRVSILNALLSSTSHCLSVDEILEISSKTHGYVGADLAAVVREAGIHAIRRTVSSVDNLDTLLSSLQINELSKDPSLCISKKDVDLALLKVKPSAMREITLDIPKVSWSDIGGNEDVKQRIKEAVEWPLLNPDAFTRFNIKPPRGILLYGPPGCSKTLLAKAVASSGGLNFIAVKGPEIFSKYVGESEKAVRKVFARARAASPCVVFFDEIDAIGIARGGAKNASVNDRVLAQLLAELDGILPLDGVVILAATNQPDVIDPALMRPGRIDRMVYVGPPDFEARCEILRIRMRRMSAGDVDVEVVARMADGFSGAEVVAICQEAAMLAMEEDVHAEKVEQKHFEEGVRLITPSITKKVLAFYEEFGSRSGPE